MLLNYPIRIGKDKQISNTCNEILSQKVCPSASISFVFVVIHKDMDAFVSLGYGVDFTLRKSVDPTLPKFVDAKLPITIQRPLPLELRPDDGGHFIDKLLRTGHHLL